jgi:spermidine/putrescine transport system ATP-binding protein
VRRSGVYGARHVSHPVAAPLTHAASGEGAVPDVALRGVTKRFGDTVAVDDLTLEVPKGAFFALIGPSGCGKTTSLRMVGGFEDPTAGRIELGGQDVTGLPPHKRDVNTVFQSYALFPHLTVAQNVAFGLERKGVKKAEARGRVDEVLALVDLEGMGARRPGQLSGGQQQRVALARALVNKPKALLLDEPLGALDLRLRRRLQVELTKIHRELGMTFLHVTHDQEEAMSMADQIAVMHRGRIEQLGAPEELYERPRTAFVARFLGTSNLVDGRLEDASTFQTRHGERLRVTANGHTGAAQAGVRPEKLELLPGDADPGGRNALPGVVEVSAFMGTAVHTVVRTPAGDELTVVTQNSGAAAPPGAGTQVLVAWDPRHTFVVTPEEEDPDVA